MMSIYHDLFNRSHTANRLDYFHGHNLWVCHLYFLIHLYSQSTSLSEWSIPQGYFLLRKAAFPLICLKRSWIQFQRVPSLWPSSPPWTSDTGCEQKEIKGNLFASSRLWEYNFLCLLRVQAMTWPQTHVAGRGPMWLRVQGTQSLYNPAMLTTWPHPWTRVIDPEKWSTQTRGWEVWGSQMQRNNLGWLLLYFWKLKPEMPRKWTKCTKSLARRVGMEHRLQGGPMSPALCLWLCAAPSLGA